MKVKDGYVLAIIIVLSIMVGALGSRLLTVSGGVPTYTVPSTCGQFALGTPPGGSGVAPYASTGGGGFTTEPGSAYSYGEILDSSSYYISWVPGGLSQTITVQGSVAPIKGCNLGIGVNNWDGARYDFTVNTGNGTFVPFYNPGVAGGTLAGVQGGPWVVSCTIGGGTCSGGGVMSAKTFQIRGVTFNATSGGPGGGYDIPDGTILRVSIALHLQGGGWYGPVGYDQAVLLRGTPSVSFDQGLYPTGGGARLTWHVPVTLLGGVSVYYLTMTYDNDKSYVVSGGVTYNQWALPANDGVASFTVPLSAFSGDASKPNTVSAHLYSQIFLAGRDISFIIGGSTGGPGPGNVSLAPTLNNVTFNKPSLQYLQGDTILITVSASPNPTTQLPIVKYYADCYIGGVEQTKTSTTSSLSFIAGSSGLMSCVVNAYDSANRPAVPQKFTFVVGNPVGLCELFPTNPQCTPAAGASFTVPAGYMIVMGLLLVLGLSALLFGLYAAENPLTKFPFVIAGVVLTLGGLALFVALVLNWVSYLVNKALAFPWPFR